MNATMPIGAELNFVQTLREDNHNRERQMQLTPVTAGFFRVRSTNRCIEDARQMKTPQKLFLSLVFEKELTILCADTGIGKSIFAVQIAEEIARSGHKVLYLDLELSDKQFEGRYSENYTNHYKFSDNLIRVDFDPDNYTIPDGYTYDDYFIKSLEEAIQEAGADVVVIDNMTALSFADTDGAKNAKPLMDRLNRLKKERNLTMLVLEHTRKTEAGRPISLNDLQGSKMKANFADAVFMIGRSTRDKNLRYVKQVKCRSAEQEYDANNVLLYEVCKKNGNFLSFEFHNYSKESDHLQLLSDDDTAARKARARELKAGGMSNVAIAKELGVSEGTVRYYLKNG